MQAQPTRKPRQIKRNQAHLVSTTPTLASATPTRARNAQLIAAPSHQHTIALHLRHLSPRMRTPKPKHPESTRTNAFYTDDLTPTALTHDGILRWLLQNNDTELQRLWTEADRVRREVVGDEVHLRGLVEISNYCRRMCGYCGIRAGNTRVERYRMTFEQVLAASERAFELGYGTVVLQAGEDPGITNDWMVRLIKEIKRTTGLAITLSLGERDPGELEAWKRAGADRYLLRFETSDNQLYQRIHPPWRTPSHPDLPRLDSSHRDSSPNLPTYRFTLLKYLKELGYEVGSGVMVGIPGQRWESLARDIELFRELDLDMIGVGPYLPHPHTPLGKEAMHTEEGNQVTATEEVVYKVIALARIMCPEANIPSTTALGALNQTEGRALGLMRGANVVMPNLTPAQYREKYEIYPEKACASETSEQFHLTWVKRIEQMQRRVGVGTGPRKKHR